MSVFWHPWLPNKRMNTTNEPTKLTPLFTLAQKLGGQFVRQDGWQIASAFAPPEMEMSAACGRVALADCSANGKIQVEGQLASIVVRGLGDIPELAAGQGAAANAHHIFRLRPDQFFISTPVGGEKGVLERLHAAAAALPDLTTITPVTHGRAELWLIGPQASILLSRLCGLDFHDSQFPNLAARQSSVAKTRQLILRRDVGTLPVYALIGGRSLAAYLWQTILECGRDLNIQPIGLNTLQELPV